MRGLRPIIKFQQLQSTLQILLQILILGWLLLQRLGVDELILDHPQPPEEVGEGEDKDFPLVLYCSSFRLDFIFILVHLSLQDDGDVQHEQHGELEVGDLPVHLRGYKEQVEPSHMGKVLRYSTELWILRIQF